MYEQFAKNYFDFSRQAADTALKVAATTANTANEAFKLQLETAEEQTKSAGNVWQDAGEVRDLEGAQKIWAQGSELVRENLEKSLETHQQVVELGLTRNQELSDLFQGTFEAAKTQAKKATKAATK